VDVANSVVSVLPFRKGRGHAMHRQQEQCSAVSQFVPYKVTHQSRSRSMHAYGARTSKMPPAAFSFAMHGASLLGWLCTRLPKNIGDPNSVGKSAELMMSFAANGSPSIGATFASSSGVCPFSVMVARARSADRAEQSTPAQQPRRTVSNSTRRERSCDADQ
jgi:hypothetical protein